MARFNVGDVGVILYFPNQEDDTSGTTRWIVVLDNYETFCTIVPFTTNLNQTSIYSKTIKIYKDSVEGKKMGLEKDSILILDRIIEEFQTNRMTPFLKKGTCPEHILDQINDLLKKN